MIIINLIICRPGFSCLGSSSTRLEDRSETGVSTLSTSSHYLMANQPPDSTTTTRQKIPKMPGKAWTRILPHNVRDNYPNQIHWIFGKLPNGGGGHFRSEKFCCGFSGNFGAVKTMNFRKKGGGHANPNEFRCKFLGVPKKAQHCFPKIWRGGGSEAVWKFSENSLNLVQIVIPFQLIFSAWWLHWFMW